ncbi:ATP-binding protein [Candidatus Peregrinibacteria bacterium]|jgi:uncharacterized protein|nr:ATP-binding protein [Candidatus Peregrinibacteria bacterium]
MNIKRTIKQEILKRLSPKRAIVIYGPRRVGKTTLIKEIVAESKSKKIKFISGEDVNVQKWLSSQSIEELKSHVGDTELLVIDEAQYVNKIGLNLKLIIDHIETVNIIATGSSSFELSNQIGEPLVGRKWQFELFPFAQLELKEYEALHETQARLEERIIFGSYPEVVLAENKDEKQMILESIVDNNLYKDAIILDDVRRSQKIIDLLKLIAFQIGQEVSLNELSNALGLNIETVARYLDLLEKVFVIKRVGGFSRNLRKEVTKTARYYFYDNGVRNAVIQNFNTLDLRNDVGQLWENYLFMERLKKRKYQNMYANMYFWRTYDQKEVDLVEERDGKLYGYEFKWGPKKVKPPKLWLETYEEAEFEFINKDNYLEFIA